MEEILGIVAQILRPLSVGLIFTSILAGTCLGVFYNYPMNIDPRMVFHKAVAGWVFILFVFLYRMVNSLAEGTAGIIVQQFWGWIGIAILWGIFCGAIYLTNIVSTRLLLRHIK